MFKITNTIEINENEIHWSAIRSQGAGGQNVNKVSSAIHLRFDISASSLPGQVKEKLLLIKDKRITKDGVIVIKAQRFRTQEKNKEDGYERLRQLILAATYSDKKRKQTKPSRNAKKRRLDSKTKRGQLKKLRGRVSGNIEG